MIFPGIRQGLAPQGKRDRKGLCQLILIFKEAQWEILFYPKKLLQFHT
jgi:hypothetical protein